MFTEFSASESVYVFSKLSFESSTNRIFCPVTNVEPKTKSINRLRNFISASLYDKDICNWLEGTKIPSIIFFSFGKTSSASLDSPVP